MGYQQSVACCSKLIKLLFKVLFEIINVNITNTLLVLLEKIENNAKDSQICSTKIYLPGIYVTNWTSKRCCYANDDMIN